jgi:hypothetical protein
VDSIELLQHSIEAPIVNAVQTRYPCNPVEVQTEPAMKRQPMRLDTRNTLFELNVATMESSVVATKTRT